MNGETISRAQVLLQYYAALAELEQESRLAAAHAAKAAHTVHGSARVERMQPIVVQKEMRVSA